ncbi:MAG TPA: type VI secretion system baseplate subunit TssG [Burkholderiales bacterium]|nr:type VI secretion system baseplate subunit TssG [Burkholderiales bacterium]
MAAVGWHADRPLAAQLRSDWTRFDFYQLVRLLSRERAVRFRADLGLVFPAHEVTGVDGDDTERALRVTTPEYGVGGYLGPLPESFTEWAQELRARGDRAMADFLDLFSDRLNRLRFSLKARTNTALNDRKPEDTPQAERLGAIAGVLDPGLAAQLPLSRRALLGIAGLIANRRRTVATIEQVLARFLATRVEVMPLRGAWQTIPESDHTRLGRRNSRLGRDTVLGRRVWDQSARIDVHIGPLPYASFLALLPGGRLHGTLAALLRFLSDRQVDSRVLLQLDGDPPPATLRETSDAATLAQTAWLSGAPGSARVATFVIPAYDEGAARAA